MMNPRAHAILAPILATFVLGACTDESEPAGPATSSSNASQSSAAVGGASTGGSTSAGGESAGGSGGGGNTICAHDAPFETITDVLGVNTSENHENNARLSHDELTIVFGRKGTGGFDKTTQYIATRNSPNGAFGTPGPLFAEANQGFDEFSAWLSDDQKTVYWDTTGLDSNYFILISTRTSTAVPFSRQGAMLVDDVYNGNPLLGDYEPFVVPGVGMYFGSMRTQNADLYFAAGDGSGFMPPMPIAGLNTTAGEELPTPSLDGLALYFYGSDREPGGMSADVWLSTRATKNAAFTTSTRDLGVLNTAGYEYPTWISDDNCRLYITAYDANNVQNIRVATRTP